jgi:hypothetical protein
MLKLRLANEEFNLIRLIARRACCASPEDFELTYLMMDITVVHLNSVQLDLEKLLTAPPVTFAHDICGIVNNLDRKTGELLNCFLPKCTALSFLTEMHNTFGEKS